MPKGIHLPEPLLEAVDRQARRLKISRNRFIVRALEKAIARPSGWSPGFFERLAAAEPQVVSAVDEMLEAIRATRQRRSAQAPPAARRR